MSVDWVRLELDISRFEPTRFADLMAEVQGAGIRLTTLAELGNTTAQQQSLHALNAECAADILDRGPFFTWSEFRRMRLDGPSFEPHGVVVAFDRDSWVGLAATSDHREHGYVFNELTGAVRGHRGRGIALAMKVRGMDFASRCGVHIARTVHHPRNLAMIALNRRLGYVDATWSHPPTPEAT